MEAVNDVFARFKLEDLFLGDQFFHTNCLAQTSDPSLFFAHLQIEDFLQA